MSGDVFTFDQFKAELLTARGLLSSRKFWQLPQEQRDRAVGGLGYVYLHLDATEGEVQNAADMVHAFGIEYQMRARYFP